ncbi:restriction endonuclease subunit S [Yersinia sp. 2553 StPb PI]|uniref:restriction endonuclease subunit S n=1 Tax=Yersinia sp. 2553 StPb PI TaxID=3117411 RepID=UPI003FA4590E
MSNWNIEKLKGKINIKHGFPFKGEFFSEKETDYIVLTPGNFFEEGGFKRQAGKEKYYSGEIPEGYLHEKGDLIVAMTEQTPGLLGSCARIPESGIYLHNQRLGLITTDPKYLLKDYIYHLFRTNIVREQIRLTSSGSKVKHTSPDRIYDVKVPLPSVEEQQRIIDFFNLIEEKIDLNLRINTELETMAQMLYEYWFVQFDFPDINGNPYKNSGGKMVYNPKLKREIPIGWVPGTLDDLGHIVGGSTPSTNNPENFTLNGTAWITPNDLSNNQGYKFISHGAQDVSEAGIKGTSLKKYPAGTVLLSSRAPIGYMAIAINEVTTNQGFKSFIPTKGYSTEYVYYSVKKCIPIIEQHASGSTFKEISGSALKEINIILPEINITDKFTKTVINIFRRQENLERENKQLIKLRDWLLPMLINGQVTVR